MSSSSNIAKEEFATRNSSFQYYSRFITACWTNICFVQWDISFHLRLSQVARFCIHKTTPYYHDSHLHRSQNEWVVAPTDCCIATRLLSERTTASGACHRSVWCVAVACLDTGPRGKQPTRRGKKAASSVQISDCCPNELWVLELASVWF